MDQKANRKLPFHLCILVPSKAVTGLKLTSMEGEQKDLARVVKYCLGSESAVGSRTSQ